AFAMMSLNERMLGFTLCSESVLLLFTLGGVLFLLKDEKAKNRKWDLLGGLLFGFGLLTKQVEIFFILFALFLIGFPFYKRASFDLRKASIRIVPFLIGVLAPYLLTLLILAMNGALGQFLFFTFQ